MMNRNIEHPIRCRNGRQEPPLVPSRESYLALLDVFDALYQHRANTPPLMRGNTSTISTATLENGIVVYFGQPAMADMDGIVVGHPQEAEK